jgi:hypothetical protein
VAELFNLSVTKITSGKGPSFLIQKISHTSPISCQKLRIFIHFYNNDGYNKRITYRKTRYQLRHTPARASLENLEIS